MTFTGEGPADQVLIGTVGGVYQLERQDDSSWRVAWNALEDNHVSSVQLEPESGTVFAGVYRGGIHASEDGGKTWEPRNEGLASEDIYSLSYAKTQDGTVLYAGTEPAHLFRSEDMGARWSEIESLLDAPSREEWTFPGPPHIAHVKFIAIDPDDPETLFAGVEVGGLLKSRDGGETWEEQHGFYEDVHRIAICRDDPDKVYITTGAGLYHTVDGGAHWDRMTDHSMRIGYPDAMVLVPDRDGLMFMSGARNTPGAWRKTHTADSKVARSRDGGKTWQLLSEGLPEHMRANMESMSVVSWGEAFELFAGTTSGDIYYSDDEGEHWSKIMADLPPVSKFHHYRGLR